METTTRRAASILILATLAGCAIPQRTPTDYAGSDAGALLLSTKAPVFGNAFLGPDRWYIHIAARKADDKGKPKQQQSHFLVSYSAWEKEAAFKRVHITLPPGRYEMFEVSGGNHNTTRHAATKEEFSIPFEIRSGRVTYIGAYEAMVHDTGSKVSFTFSVSNRLELDKSAVTGPWSSKPLDSSIPTSTVLAATRIFRLN